MLVLKISKLMYTGLVIKKLTEWNNYIPTNVPVMCGLCTKDVLN